MRWTPAILITQAIVFAALLISGAILFLAVASYGVDWFPPTMFYMVAVFLGWTRFIDPPSNYWRRRIEDYEYRIGSPNVDEL